jgi:hypothetical protein
LRGFKCNRCKQGESAAGFDPPGARYPDLEARGRAEMPVMPVHMIKLTATQEITPYQWVHPDEER